MEFVQDVIDEGVEEIPVCGVEAIGADLVRVTCFKNRRDGKTVATHMTDFV